MTFEEYIQEVQRTFEKWSTASDPWRMGQTYFNVLCELRPDLSEQIRSDFNLDPFYRDQVIPEFTAWARAHWDEGSQSPLDGTTVD